MLSESQRLYLEEVLGTTPAAYRRAAPAIGSAGVAIEPATASVDEVAVEPEVSSTVVVLTPPLGEAARALLVKILGSVKLSEFSHVEGLEPVAAPHVLHFAAAAIPGRSTTAHGVCWGFHDLEKLIGTSNEVTQLKREVWTLLQTFAREVPCSNS